MKGKESGSAASDGGSYNIACPAVRRDRKVVATPTSCVREDG